MVFYRKFEPFGEWRADIRAGEMIAPILNLLRQLNLKTPGDPKLPSDWTHKYGDWGTAPQASEPTAMDSADIKTMFMNLAKHWPKERK